MTLTYDELLRRLANDCQHDWVSLWVIVTAVRRNLGATDPGDVHRLTLGVVRDLLTRHRVAAGNFVDPPSRHFAPWDLPLKCALDRIAHEWKAIGCDPGMWQIVCLATPDLVRQKLALSPSSRLRV
jgi:hypothetical protein